MERLPRGRFSFEAINVISSITKRDIYPITVFSPYISGLWEFFSTKCPIVQVSHVRRTSNMKTTRGEPSQYSTSKTETLLCSPIYFHVAKRSNGKRRRDRPAHTTSRDPPQTRLARTSRRPGPPQHGRHLLVVLVLFLIVCVDTVIIFSGIAQLDVNLQQKTGTRNVARTVMIKLSMKKSPDISGIRAEKYVEKME